MSDWRTNLASAISNQDQAKKSDQEKSTALHQSSHGWFATVVAPALEEFATELRKHGREVRVYTGNPEAMGLNVTHGGQTEFECSIDAKVSGNNVSVDLIERLNDRSGRNKAHSPLGEFQKMTKDQILQMLVSKYQDSLKVR